MIAHLQKLAEQFFQSFSENFMTDYMDITVFAVIAVILLWRLRSVLGMRSEHDQPPITLAEQKKQQTKTQKNSPDSPRSNDKSPAKLSTKAQVKNLAQNTRQEPTRWAQALPDFSIVDSATAHSILTQFPAFDPEFRPDDFLEKAKKTFVLIVTAYAGGNKNTLEMLLSPDLFRHFAEQLDVRAQSKEVYLTQLHGLQKALITDASLTGSVAHITVSFIAEQSITHKDDLGRVMDNRDGRRIVTRDRWVFTRDLKKANALWILDKTLEHAE